MASADDLFNDFEAWANDPSITMDAVDDSYKTYQALPENMYQALPENTYQALPENTYQAYPDTLPENTYFYNGMLYNAALPNLDSPLASTTVMNIDAQEFFLTPTTATNNAETMSHGIETTAVCTTPVGATADDVHNFTVTYAPASSTETEAAVTKISVHQDLNLVHRADVNSNMKQEGNFLPDLLHGAEVPTNNIKQDNNFLPDLVPAAKADIPKYIRLNSSCSFGSSGGMSVPSSNTTAPRTSSTASTRSPPEELSPPSKQAKRKISDVDLDVANLRGHMLSEFLQLKAALEDELNMLRYQLSKAEEKLSSHQLNLIQKKTSRLRDDFTAIFLYNDFMNLKYGKNVVAEILRTFRMIPGVDRVVASGKDNRQLLVIIIVGKDEVDEQLRKFNAMMFHGGRVRAQLFVDAAPWNCPVVTFFKPRGCTCEEWLM